MLPSGLPELIADDESLARTWVKSTAFMPAPADGRTSVDIRRCGLDVTAQEPPPRHADIIDWPESSTEAALAKARHKELAVRIAASARLVRLDG